MKPENKKFEENISRLVKSTGDLNKPNKDFTESLIDNAIGKLKSPEAIPSRKRKGPVMTAKKMLTLAASIIVVCSIVLTMVVRNTSESEETSSVSFVKEIKKPAPLTTEVRRNIKSKESEVVFTEVPSQQKKFDKVALDSSNSAFQIAKGAKSVKQLGVAVKSEVLGKRPAFVGTPMFQAAENKLYYPMANGGNRPPNGEDVDAQFFKNYGVNPFVDAEDDHLSTFATDVDTASYSIVRKYLHDGHLPPEKAVRVEEFVNYFKYDYKGPQENDFAVYSECTPWKFGASRKNSHLLRIGLKAKEISKENRKSAILTFVIDVSGSMNRENRLGLVKKSLQMLVKNLTAKDKIGIVVYGSRARVILEPKSLEQKDEIITAIEMLQAEGSTFAEEGIKAGYDMAEKAYQKGYINRVILCSDGVANVGQTGADAILEAIKQKTAKGITLSAIGFGMGNYNDVLLEQLGDKGNGYYSYIDTIVEAKKLFEENLTTTLQVVARDVKVQVDFNPDVVRSYRLIGYENRDVPDDKFRDDKYDGGEMGAGHCVTALYELKLWDGKKGNIATTYVRYKDVQTLAATEFKSSIATKDVNTSIDNCSSDFKLAMTSAEFAEILRKSYWAKEAKLENVLARSKTLINEFPNNTDVIEFVDLISKADQLMAKDDSPNETDEQ